MTGRLGNGKLFSALRPLSGFVAPARALLGLAVLLVLHLCHATGATGCTGGIGSFDLLGNVVKGSASVDASYFCDYNDHPQCMNWNEYALTPTAFHCRFDSDGNCRCPGYPMWEYCAMQYQDQWCIPEGELIVEPGCRYNPGVPAREYATLDSIQLAEGIYNFQWRSYCTQWGEVFYSSTFHVPASSETWDAAGGPSQTGGTSAPSGPGPGEPGSSGASRPGGTCPTCVGNSPYSCVDPTPRSVEISSPPDLTLKSPLGDLQIERKYRTSYLADEISDGMFGKGWRGNLEFRIGSSARMSPAVGLLFFDGAGQ